MINSIRKLRWSHVGYFVLSVASLVGVFMLMGLVAKKDQGQYCTSLRVVVQGRETFIDQQDVSSMIEENFGQVIGQPLHELPAQQIESELKQSPYVAKADVFMDMDGVLQVTIQQREVIVRIINQQGDEFYVDGEGKKIPVTLKYVPHVMVANGFIAEGYQTPLEPVETELVKDLVKIVKWTADDELWKNQIVQLYVNQDRDIEIVPRVGQQQLILGSADSLAHKLERLEKFYTHILPRVGTEAYSSVNVKYGGQIVCERKGDWFIDSLQMVINKK
ncbi:MAG TPA: cell division protein FtsQ [Candidatus Sphingobacterium stercorigallinarum]|nr:cell division protein FtsQ [Candidatus Sphingobacterium stercorigallinarum]